MNSLSKKLIYLSYALLAVYWIIIVLKLPNIKNIILATGITSLWVATKVSNKNIKNRYRYFVDFLFLLVLGSSMIQQFCFTNNLLSSITGLVTILLAYLVTYKL